MKNVNPITRRKWQLTAVIAVLFLAMLSCSESDQAELATTVAEVAQTAAAEGIKLAGTEAAELATQMAAITTEIANQTPSPWDIAWLPADDQVVVKNIEAILNGSGLQGQGAIMLLFAKQYGVNPAFTLAMFRKEAEFAKPGTRSYKNNNPGNIIATGECRGLPAGSNCNGSYGEIGTDGRFGVYASMADGVQAYFELLSSEYKPGTKRNCQDIPCIISAYCPPSDCDTEVYILQITGWTKDYQGKLLVTP